MLRAADVMTEDPTTAQPDTTLLEATRTLDSLSIRHLPVVDDNGGLVGMLSDRDLRGDLSPSARVADLMNSNVVQALADDDLIVIADLIVENGVGAIPIVDERGALVGIVSYVDILRALGTIAGSGPAAEKPAPKKPAPKKPAPKKPAPKKPAPKKPAPKKPAPKKPAPKKRGR